MGISVLIPTMNRPETLKKTLDSFFSGDVVPTQLVVVDQSTQENADTIKSICEEYSNAKIKYVHQSTPSLTKARNNAYKYATEDIVICSDDDVLIYKDTLKNIVDIMERKDIAMIAGIDDYTLCSSTNIGYLFGTKSYKNRKIGHVTLSILGRYPDNVRGEIETQWAMGYFFVIRKSLLDKWNIKWDEKLTSYAYAEDLDFSYNYFKAAKKENLKCVLNEKVHIKHCVSREYRTPSKKSTYMYVINRYYLSFKHNMGFKSRIAMHWTNFGHMLEMIANKEPYKDMIYAKRDAKMLRKKDFLILTEYFDNQF